MSRMCDICEKTYQRGNLVPRGVGRRVTRRTLTRQQPNLRSKKIDLNGSTIKVKLCASCLKRLKLETAKKVSALAAKTAVATA